MQRGVIVKFEYYVAAGQTSLPQVQYMRIALDSFLPIYIDLEQRMGVGVIPENGLQYDSIKISYGYFEL